MLIALILMFIIPIVLTIYNLYCLFKENREKPLRNFLWALTLILGVLFTIVLFSFGNVDFDAKWNAQLINNQTHQPIWSGGWLTIVVISLLGVLGAIILIANNVNKLAPLVTVICISSMYLAMVIQVIWAIQCISFADNELGAMYLLLPLNLLIIVICIIKEKIIEWQQQETHTDAAFGKNELIKILNTNLMYASSWPIIAFLFALPLLGIILLILVLFGQQPDAAIKAWTETSDWTFSLKEGPQNLYVDEHYLCTVAAGGHTRVVKPIRMGERHGHAVIVNRQLLVANAFENVLEEKTPKVHRAIRNFYDKYGFPIADLIRPHKIACDITYYIMKPLEWIFLIVLYLVDANPENRIAVQYMPKQK